jgi:hypothetical protein
VNNRNAGEFVSSSAIFFDFASFFVAYGTVSEWKRWTWPHGLEASFAALEHLVSYTALEILPGVRIAPDSNSPVSASAADSRPLRAKREFPRHHCVLSLLERICAPSRQREIAQFGGNLGDSGYA